MSDHRILAVNVDVETEAELWNHRVEKVLLIVVMGAPVSQITCSQDSTESLKIWPLFVLKKPPLTGFRESLLHLDHLEEKSKYTVLHHQ